MLHRLRLCYRVDFHVFRGLEKLAVGSWKYIQLWSVYRYNFK